jgi:hypothetical protein
MRGCRTGSRAYPTVNFAVNRSVNRVLLSHSRRHGDIQEHKTIKRAEDFSLRRSARFSQEHSPDGTI